MFGTIDEKRGIMNKYIDPQGNVVPAKDIINDLMTQKTDALESIQRIDKLPFDSETREKLVAVHQATIDMCNQNLSKS